MTEDIWEFLGTRSKQIITKMKKAGITNYVDASSDKEYVLTVKRK